MKVKISIIVSLTLIVLCGYVYISIRKGPEPARNEAPEKISNILISEPKNAENDQQPLTAAQPSEEESQKPKRSPHPHQKELELMSQAQIAFDEFFALYLDDKNDGHAASLLYYHSLDQLSKESLQLQDIKKEFQRLQENMDRYPELLNDFRLSDWFFTVGLMTQEPEPIQDGLDLLIKHHSDEVSDHLSCYKFKTSKARKESLQILRRYLMECLESPMSETPEVADIVSQYLGEVKVRKGMKEALDEYESLKEQNLIRWPKDRFFRSP